MSDVKTVNHSKVLGVFSKWEEYWSKLLFNILYSQVQYDDIIIELLS